MGAPQHHDPAWVHAFVDSRSPKLSGLSCREALSTPDRVWRRPRRRSLLRSQILTPQVRPCSSAHREYGLTSGAGICDKQPSLLAGELVRQAT